MSTGVSGLISGIDTASMVDALVAAASRPISLLNTQKGALEDRQEAYATLASRMTALQDALNDVSDVETLRSTSGTSSDDSAVSVTVDNDAVVGRYSVEVTQLASATMAVSAGMSSRTADGTVATGTLNITVGSTTTAVTIDSNSSNLDDLVDAINEQVDGVTAYVMDTGDATNPYRLVIMGEDTGDENAVTIDTSGLDAMTGTVPTFTNATDAEDAIVSINGVEVRSASNTFDSVISGVTFNVESLTSDTVEITVEPDNDAVVAKMQAVVDAWNAVTSQIRTQKVWNPDENIKGAFVGELVPGQAMSSMQSLISSSWGTGAIDSLSALGLTTAQDGDLEFDTAAFTTALTDDFDSVIDLMSGEDGPAAALSTLIDTFTDEDEGLLTVRDESLSGQIEDIDTRISNVERKISAYRTRLEKQFTAMELAMSRFQNAESALTALLPDTNSSDS